MDSTHQRHSLRTGYCPQRTLQNPGTYRHRILHATNRTLFASCTLHPPFLQNNDLHRTATHPHCNHKVRSKSPKTVHIAYAWLRSPLHIYSNCRYHNTKEGVPILGTPSCLYSIKKLTRSFLLQSIQQQHFLLPSVLQPSCSNDA